MALCSIIYESDEQYELESVRFRWVAETLVNTFEHVKGHPQYCKYVIVERDRLELVIIRELVEFAIRYLTYFKYANIHSDIFDYLDSLEFKRVEWYNGKSNTGTDSRHCNTQTRLQSNGASSEQRYSISMCYGRSKSKTSGKFV